MRATFCPEQVCASVIDDDATTSHVLISNLYATDYRPNTPTEWHHLGAAIFLTSTVPVPRSLGTIARLLGARSADMVVDSQPQGTPGDRLLYTREATMPCLIRVCAPCRKISRAVEQTLIWPFLDFRLLRYLAGAHLQGSLL